jgi:ELP3 family radical SAM enzyme/protein acetyltransferase
MDKLQKVILELIQKKPATKAEFLSMRRKVCNSQNLTPPSNATLLSTYRQLLKSKKIKQNKAIEYYLIKGPIRTLSGVSVITVLTKPWACPGGCVYCPAEPNMPKSYLSNEPAAQRAVRNAFNPFRQVEQRILALEANGHAVDKIEILILGGSWSAYPKQYQTWFVGRLFQSCNIYGKKKRDYKGLKAEQKINENTKYKIIGLTLETRPDLINPAEIKRMRALGCTRVQLGIQHTDNEILKKINRGHTIEQSIEATKQLKEVGLKVDHHYMPDLPGSTPAKDLKMFKYVYESQDLAPDQIKIYPCIVNEYAPIYKWLKTGKYKPYTDKQLKELLIKVKTITPPWIRINRLIRDIPKDSIEAGNDITNLRQLLQIEMKKRQLECHCLRCREARSQTYKAGKAKFVTRKYQASNGIEYFLSYESTNKKIIYGFLRLRINNDNENLFPELSNASIVRELHVYGQMTPVYGEGSDEETSKQIAQHKGLGKKLMLEAEKITTKHKLNKLAVISGIGVRNYYKKLGYKLENTYMTKELTK